MEKTSPPDVQARPSRPRPGSKPVVVAVAVTYNPDPEVFANLLAALSDQVSHLVVVDNGSANRNEVAALTRARSGTYIQLGKNTGIAAAQNRGVITAKRLGATHVLLSDQDSLPAPNMVEKLLACFERASADGPVGAAGPVPVDERAGDPEALVYSFTRWGPKRREIPGPGETLQVPFVLASGSLVSMDALSKVGPFDEPLFIDHVDLAWGLRATEAGYRILVCGDSILYHSLGDSVAAVPGRRRLVHVHSPVRNYYMMRNTLFLQRARFLPARWKVGYLAWMGKYFAYYLLLARGRRTRLRYLTKALRDGITGRGGPYPH